MGECRSQNVGAKGLDTRSDLTVLPITHHGLMLATPVAESFDRAGWIFEMKYGGLRVLAMHQGRETRLLSRRGNDLLPCFPEIARCLQKLPDVVLDGELVVLDGQGKAIFERVSRRARTKRPVSVAAAARRQPAELFAFDVLSLLGKDLRRLPLLRRKEIVEVALQDSQRVRPVQYVAEHGQRLYDAACGLQLEGIVAKREDSRYKPGRSKDWLKIRTPYGRGVEAGSEKWGERVVEPS